MTDRAYLFNQLRLTGLLAMAVLLYAVGLPKLMLFLGLARRLTWLPIWDLWGTYALVGLIPLTLFSFRRAFRSVGTRASKEVTTRLYAGCTYLVLPPLHGTSALAARFSEKGDIWAQIAGLLPEGESLIVELVRTEASLCYLISGMRTTLDGGIIPQVMATLPGTQVRPVPLEEDPLLPILTTPGETRCLNLRPRHGKMQIHPASTQPFLAMVGALAPLPEGIQAGIRLLIRSDKDSSRDFQISANVQSIPILNQRNPAYTNDTRMPWESRVLTQQDQETQRDLQTRAGRHLLDVCVQVWAHAGDTTTATRHTELLAHTLQSQYTPANPLTTHAYTGNLLDRAYPTYAGRHWTDQELGTLFHFVGREGYDIAPLLRLARTRPLVPDPIHYFTPDMRVLPLRNEEVP
jgi:hypothetical protein